MALASASSIGGMNRKLQRGAGLGVEFLLKPQHSVDDGKDDPSDFLSYLGWQATSSVLMSCGQNSPALVCESLQIQYASRLRDIPSSE